MASFEDVIQRYVGDQGVPDVRYLHYVPGILKMPSSTLDQVVSDLVTVALNGGSRQAAREEVIRDLDAVMIGVDGLKILAASEISPFNVNRRHLRNNRSRVRTLTAGRMLHEFVTGEQATTTPPIHEVCNRDLQRTADQTGELSSVLHHMSRVKQVEPAAVTAIFERHELDEDFVVALGLSEVNPGWFLGQINDNGSLARPAIDALASSRNVARSMVRIHNSYNL